LSFKLYPTIQRGFRLVAHFGDRLDPSGIVAAGTSPSAALPSHVARLLLRLRGSFVFPQPR
jgi:hypothetical protein